MRKGKYAKRGVATKTMVLVLAVMLIVGATIGGTIAWLQDTTDSVVNTFTYGDIDIDLAETTKDYKMIPGNTIAKDPTVTVKADSEECWLFVKIEESDNLDDFISYTVADGWTALEGVDGVYYREVDADEADQTFAVLKDNKVTVLEDVTKTMVNGLTEETYPTLTFTAYAVQKANIATAAEAWTIATAK